MPLGEAILGSIPEAIGYIIFDLLLEGIGRFFRWIYYGIRKLLTGKEREIPEVKRLEKTYLYKKIVLRNGLNKFIVKGTRGTVLEIIDEDNFYVEFEDSTGKPIEVEGNQVFKVKRKDVMLQRKLRKPHNG